jgi:hypothetical protein
MEALSFDPQGIRLKGKLHPVNEYHWLEKRFRELLHERAMKGFLRFRGSRPGHFKALRTGDERQAHFITRTQLPDEPRKMPMAGNRGVLNKRVSIPTVLNGCHQ